MRTLRIGIAGRRIGTIETLPRLVPRRRAAPRGRVVARTYGQHDVIVRRMLALADISGLALALAAVFLVFNHHPAQFAWALLTLPIWVVVFKAYGLYDRDMKRISHMSVDDLPWLFHGLLVGCLLLLLYFRITPPGGVDFGDLAVFGAISLVSITALRATARRMSIRMFGCERVMLVGAGTEIGLLARKIEAHPEYGVKVVGMLTPTPEVAERAGVPAFGDVREVDLPAVVSEQRVERLVIAHRTFGEPAMLELLRACRELGLKVNFLPGLFDALGPSVEVDDVEGLTVLGINPPVLARSSRFLKRAMDVAGSAVLLLLTAPLQVAIAIAVKLDSPGPVLFRQQRIGRGGQPFEVIKFRTMVADAEAQREALLCKSTDPGWLLLEHDPRITRIGALLRKYSLDELPQLWTVLTGKMSLVGPRPLIESEHSQLSGWSESRIDLTPGLTGLWQVLGRTKIPFEEMVKLDYLYVTNWSLWTDVRLILRTLPAVITSRGAN